MTPVELASNHKSIFNREAILLIAERSGTSDRFVDRVIIGHDVLRADRKWYKILTQFGKPHPTSFEDRQFYAEFDRPFSESEREEREEMMEKHRQRSQQSYRVPARV